MEEIQEAERNLFQKLEKFKLQLQNEANQLQIQNGHQINDIKKKTEQLDKRIADFEKLQEKVNRSAKAQAEQVKLNVGGSVFVTARDTLLSVPHSYFFAMLGSGHWKPDRNGEYFIDRDPTYFRLILNGLIQGSISLKELSKKERERLKIELDYFQLGDLIKPPPTVSNIVSPAQWEMVLKWVKPDGDPPVFSLVYRGTRDGFDVASWRKHIGNKSNTLLLFKSGTYIFGGFTPLTWSNEKVGYFYDERSFIFTLVNPVGIPPTKYPCTGPQNTPTGRYSILNGPTIGANFGSNNDMVSNYQHNSGKLHVFFNFGPAAYRDTTGKGSDTFTGGSNSIVDELEAYVMDPGNQ